ncbi:MAG TPA: hypothetical protein VN327_16375 [Pseudonocardiaceae bacterium]|jgi:hypothetical protein|nr:hypothetical protein [Pseudonocardiaceae bacterium]
MSTKVYRDIEEAVLGDSWSETPTTETGATAAEAATSRGATGACHGGRGRHHDAGAGGRHSR